MSEVDVQPVSISQVQYHAQLLAALQTRNLNRFTQLLDQSTVDADSSCLESACREGDCTQFVQQLLQHGVDPNTLNPVLLQTPLHITAELGCYKTLRVLLHDGRIDVNARNGSDQTALHIAVTRCGEACKEDADKYRQCVGLLLDWPSNVREWTTAVPDFLPSLDVDAVDWLGNTALHYAAQNKDQDTILTLLEHGSYIGSRNYSRHMPVSGIEPETLEKFLNTRLEMPSDESVLFRYGFLVPPVPLGSALMKNKFLSDETDSVSVKLSSPSPEMEPIIQVSLSPKQQRLLLHPIISSFVHLKWQHVKKFYYYNLAFYIVFVLLLTFIILYYHIIAHYEHRQSCWSDLAAVCFIKIIVIILLAIFCFCLIVKLLFQVCMSPILYLHKWSTYPQFVLALLTFTLLFVGLGTGENAMTVITLFLSWTQLLLLTGEHPAISIYFQMFKKISCTFLKHLAWYSLLIIAFSLSFYALFHDSKIYIVEKNVSSRLFHNPFMSLFTTVAMFVGGFETKFLPFESAAGTSHIIFILFMFFLVLVLLNTFIGLAVSQVQNVQCESEIVHLMAEVNAVFDIERLLLGNPVYIHLWNPVYIRLWMRRLNLSRYAVTAWIVKFSVCLWHWCSWLQCFRNIHRSVLLFPDLSSENASIMFPFGSSSEVTHNYRLDHKILLQAASIVQKKDDGMKQQFEYLAMFRSYEERLGNIEASQLMCEALQQDILQLLRSYPWRQQ
jgi:hypothetical protein